MEPDLRDFKNLVGFLIQRRTGTDEAADRFCKVLIKAAWFFPNARSLPYISYGHPIDEKAIVFFNAVGKPDRRSRAGVVDYRSGARDPRAFRRS